MTGNDPNDANVPSNAAFQRGWVQHLVNRWGTAASGGLQHYILDNEPSIWHATHRDVHPAGATMDEVRDKIVEYGGTIKAIDPSALVSGPEEWGWSGYFYSGYDQQYGSAHGWSVLPDRNNHGGADYLPWLLDQLRQQHTASGRRLLDVFTVHYYPQGGEFSDDVSSAMQQRRNRSTRSLWDPNYVDETWINDRVRLIPRLRGWVDAYYPGTSIGITEYNWGAENHINGATTQADVLGIFGREGLDMAARWATPAAGTPTYKAMKMYRNYDGSKSAFGETSVAAAAPNPDAISAFAAQRTSDGAVTVMVISKQLSGMHAGDNQPRQLPSPRDGRGLAVDVRQRDRPSARMLRSPATRVSVTLPPQSITLFVIAKALRHAVPAAPTNFRMRAGRSKTRTRVLCFGLRRLPLCPAEAGCGRSPLHGVGQRREVEVADRAAPASSAPRVVGHGAADVLEPVQHQQRALVPAEVLQRARDLALLDEERPVAREAGLQHRSRIERADVEEVRHEDAALAARDQLLGGLRAAGEREAAGKRRSGRLLALLLRPEPRVRQVPQDALLDPDRARQRQPLGSRTAGRGAPDPTDPSRA